MHATDENHPGAAVPTDVPRRHVLVCLLYTSGAGLGAKTIAGCDHAVRIPMAHGVDSLNVAAASAVAFWPVSYTHLASAMAARGKNVVIGSADTFRAAAIEQLEVWARRAGVDVYKRQVQRVCGHDIPALIELFGRIKAEAADTARPVCVIARTVKGLSLIHI